MGINHPRWAGRTAVMLSLLAACHVHAATPAADADGAEGDRTAKTIDLLLKLQGSASAPTGAARGAELPAIKHGQRAAESNARNPFNQAADVLPATPTQDDVAAKVAQTEPDLSDLPLRTRRAPEASSMLVEGPAVDARELLPVKVMRFLRENREIAIAAALVILVLAAMAGAAAGSGARKR